MKTFLLAVGIIVAVLLVAASIGHSVKTLLTCDGIVVTGAFRYECIES